MGTIANPIPTCDLNDPASLGDRFWKKVSKGDGCWDWTGAIQGAGYGVFWVGVKSKLAHRLSYESLVGPIPEGLVIDHLCRNRACVNPSHLEVVTHRVNILRGEGLAAVEAVRTHCPRGHEYAGSNLRVLGGRRFCRECQRIRDNNRRVAAQRRNREQQSV